MALTITELYAGDSLQFTAAHNEYSTDNWTHSVSLTNLANDYQLASTDGVFDIPSSITQTWVPAKYQWAWYVTDANGNRRVLQTGELTIKPDPLTAADHRTHAQRMIDAIQARLEGKATEDQLTISHNGKSVTRYTTDELTKLLNYYKAERAVERRNEARKNGVNRQSVKVRFTQG